MKRNDKRRGFTIVELVIVIAIIGILASVTIVGFTAALNNAKEKAALVEARGIYAEHTAENTELLTGTYYVKVEDGKFYFEVVDGTFQEKPVQDDEIDEIDPTKIIE